MQLLAAGAPLARARAAAVLVHGRGASAEDILSLGAEFGQDDIAYLAPQAREPRLVSVFVSRAARAERAASQPCACDASARRSIAWRSEGFAPERVALIGFSQGGCLALEYAARNAKRYGAIAGLSAGLIGPPGTPRDYAGSFAGTPVFLGCSDVDSHIPLARVHETRDVLGRMGAAVTERIYPGMGHTMNADEIAAVGKLLAGIGGV